MAQITISPPSKDSWLSQTAPDTNYGDNTSLGVKTFAPSKNSRTVIEFDISEIPADATITLAKLRLNAYSTDTGRTYEYHRITGSWTEGGVTWNDPPAVTETNKVSVASPSEVGWCEVTVTNQVADARALGTIYGVRIKDAVEDFISAEATWYRSKEYDGYDPELYVEYTIPGWTGKVSGVTNPAKVMGVDVANIAKVKGVA